MGYSIQLYFEKYVEECKVKNENPLSLEEYLPKTISFKSPKSDSCQRCDTFYIAITYSKYINEIKSLEVQPELHQRQAETRQNEISKVTKENNENDNVHLITFDLHHTLPTQKLSTGPMFYKRKLQYYSLSVHSCGYNQGFFSMG